MQEEASHTPLLPASWGGGGGGGGGREYLLTMTTIKLWDTWVAVVISCSMRVSIGNSRNFIATGVVKPAIASNSHCRGLSAYNQTCDHAWICHHPVHTIRPVTMHTTQCILPVISFNNHTCDHAHVTSKMSLMVYVYFQGQLTHIISFPLIITPVTMHVTSKMSLRK